MAGTVFSGQSKMTATQGTSVTPKILDNKPLLK